MIKKLFLILMLALLTVQVHAQIQVGLSIKRRLFLAYEPLIATITVNNLTGKDITLEDKGTERWFGFQVESSQGRLIPPLNPDYQLPPLKIGAGEVVKRSVNLVSLYPATEFGLYRVKANIFFGELDRYFSSQLVTFEVTEGRLLWQQTVGVPEGQVGAGEYRTLSLLSHRLPKDNMLYVRVQDKEAGLVLSTYPLGRILNGVEPDIEIDTANNLHVLQLVGPKTFLYSQVGVNGEWMGQTTYAQAKRPPKLKRTPSGMVEVAGGDVVVPAKKDAPPAAKISDRPAGLPVPKAP